ncbi:MAG: hypothetical protein R3C49_12095 [Planctomycetaceae bacterium]
MQIPFYQRLPSTQWEPLAIPRVPGLSLWAWFRPGQLPNGFTVSIPAELVGTYVSGFPFSLADLLTACGVGAGELLSLSLFGQDWQPAQMVLPFLNHALPPVPAGRSPEIRIAAMAVAPGMAAPMNVPMMAAGVSASGSALEFAPGMEESSHIEEFGEEDDGAAISEKAVYDRMESSWKASLQMERQMTGLRAKLSSMLNTLGKLDRELSPDERLAAERDDRDAWTDARRWLRDLAAKCHREIKAFDIGMTSGAGRRNNIEHIYQTYVEPRASCSDLESHRRDFETYRKDMVNLQRAMNGALQTATQNGTQRAQRVLGVIGRKIRERRAKMREAIGGANMDKTCRKKR